MEDYEYLMPATTIALRFDRSSWEDKKQPPLIYKLSDKELSQFFNELQTETNIDVLEKNVESEYLLWKNFLTHMNIPKYLEAQYRYLN